MRFLIIVALLAWPLVARAESVLFDSGETPYRIVLGPDASESEAWAAEELARVLKIMSGAEFPIISDDLQHGYQEIVVGHNAMLTRLLGPAVPKPKPEDESFQIRTHGPAILIWGGSQRGTMYGVFTFLTRYLGCRWWTPETEQIPRRNRWAFSTIDYQETPGIRFRDVDYFCAYQGKRGALGKVNSQRFRRSHKPGGLERFWFEHSFEILVPPGEYFDTHPEYFSLVDGKRQKERSQLCLTNPDLVPIAVEKLKWIFNELPDYRVYNVAQNDNQNYCQCEHCAALAEKEGSQIGPILQFVNLVATEIEKEFPKKIIGTFAYQYSRKPPLHLRPRHNVSIVLCNIECDFSHPLTHPNNAAFVEDIEGWTAITDQVFIWDYVVNYRGFFLPHPNFSVLQPNIQFLSKHNVQGILEQAAYQSHAADFSELRAWLLARLLWNPQIDVRLATEDFINGYYGRAAPAMQRYFDLVQGLVTEDSRITFATRPSNPIFTREFLVKGNRILDQAEILAESENIYHRVRKERLGLLYLEMVWEPETARAAGMDDALEAICQKEGIVFSSEGTTVKSFLKKFRNQTE